MRWLKDPLLWLIMLFIALLVGLPYSGPLFAWWFPEQARPLYQQESFLQLALAHLFLVITASVLALLIGAGGGVLVTRRAGRRFRPLVETIVAAGQTVPPVAVLAIAVPVMGFGAWPAVVALLLYGLLPILQGTLAGLDSVPASSRGDRRRGRHERMAAFVAGGAGAGCAGDSGWRTHFSDRQYRHGSYRLDGGRGKSRLAGNYRSERLQYRLRHSGALLVALLAIVSDRLFERLQRWLSVSGE